MSKLVTALKKKARFVFLLLSNSWSYLYVFRVPLSIFLFLTMVFSMAFNTFIGVNLQINQKIRAAGLVDGSRDFSKSISIDENYYPERVYDIFCTDFFEFRSQQDASPKKKQDLLRLPKIDFGAEGCFQKIPSDKLHIAPIIDPVTQRVTGLQKKTSLFQYDHNLLGLVKGHSWPDPYQFGKNGVFLEEDALQFNHNNIHFQKSVYGQLLAKYEETNDYSYIERADELKAQFMPELRAFVETQLAKKLEDYFARTEFYATFRVKEIPLSQFFSTFQQRDVTLSRPQLSQEQNFFIHDWILEFESFPGWDTDDNILQKNFAPGWRHFDETLKKEKKLYDKKLLDHSTVQLSSSEKTAFANQLETIFNQTTLTFVEQKEALIEFLNTIDNAQKTALFFDWILISEAIQDSNTDTEEYWTSEPSLKLRLLLNCLPRITAIFTGAHNLRTQLYEAILDWEAAIQKVQDSYGSLETTFNTSSIAINGHNWNKNTLKNKVTNLTNQDIYFIDDLLGQIERQTATVNKHFDLLALYHVESTETPAADNQNQSFAAKVNNFIAKLNALYYRSKVNENDFPRVDFSPEFAQINNLPDLADSYKKLTKSSIENNWALVMESLNRMNWLKNVFFRQNLTLYQWLQNQPWSWNDLISSSNAEAEVVEAEDTNDFSASNIEHIRKHFGKEEWKTFFSRKNTKLDSKWTNNHLDNNHFAVFLIQNTNNKEHWEIKAFFYSKQTNGKNWLRKYHLRDEKITFAIENKVKTIKSIEANEASATLNLKWNYAKRFFFDSLNNQDNHLAFNNLVAANRIVIPHKGFQEKQTPPVNKGLLTDFFDYLFYTGIDVTASKDNDLEITIRPQSDKKAGLVDEGKIWNNYSIFDWLSLMMNTNAEIDQAKFIYLEKLFDYAVFLQTKTVDFLLSLQLPDYTSIKNSTTEYDHSAVNKQTVAESNFFNRFPAFRRYHELARYVSPTVDETEAEIDTAEYPTLHDHEIFLKKKKSTDPDFDENSFDTEVYKNKDFVSYVDKEVLTELEKKLTKNSPEELKKSDESFLKTVDLNHFMYLWSKNYDLVALESWSRTFAETQNILVLEKLSDIFKNNFDLPSLFKKVEASEATSKLPNFSFQCQFNRPTPNRNSPDSTAPELSTKFDFCLNIDLTDNYTEVTDESPANKNYTELRKYVVFFLRTHIKDIASDVWKRRVSSPKYFLSSAASTESTKESKSESTDDSPSSLRIKLLKEMEVLKKISFFENVVLDNWVDHLYDKLAPQFNTKLIKKDDPRETFRETFMNLAYENSYWRSAFLAHFKNLDRIDLSNFVSLHYSYLIWFYNIQPSITKAKDKIKSLTASGFLPEQWTVDTVELAITDLDWLQEVTLQNDEKVATSINLPETFQAYTDYSRTSSNLDPFSQKISSEDSSSASSSDSPAQDTKSNSIDQCNTESATAPEIVPLNSLFRLNQLSLDFVSKQEAGNWINFFDQEQFISDVIDKIKYSYSYRMGLDGWQNKIRPHYGDNKQFGEQVTPTSIESFTTLKSAHWLPQLIFERKDQPPQFDNVLKIFLHGTRFINIYVKLGVWKKNEAGQIDLFYDDQYVNEDWEPLNSEQVDQSTSSAENQQDKRSFTGTIAKDLIILNLTSYGDHKKNLDVYLLNHSFLKVREHNKLKESFIDIENWELFPQIYFNTIDQSRFLVRGPSPNKFATFYRAVAQLLDYELTQFSSSYITDGGQSDSKKLLVKQHDSLNLQLEEGSSKIKYWNEIIVDTNFARDNDVGIGDRLTILGSPNMEIVGIGNIPEFIFPGINPLNILSSKKEGIFIVSDFFYSSIASQLQHKIGVAYAYSYTHFFLRDFTAASSTETEQKEKFNRFLSAVGEQPDSGYTNKSLALHPPLTASGAVEEDFNPIADKQETTGFRSSSFQSVSLPPYYVNRQVVSLIWVFFNFTSITLMVVVSLIWFVSLLNLLRRKLDETKKATGTLKAQGIRNQEIFVENFSVFFILLTFVLLGWVLAVFLQIPIFSTLESKTSFSFQKFSFDYGLLVVSLVFVLIFYFLFALYFQKRNISDAGVIKLINKKLAADNSGYWTNRAKTFFLRVLPFSNRPMTKINYTFIFLIWKKIIGLLVVIIFLTINFMTTFFLYTTPTQTVKKQYENINYTWDIKYTRPSIANPFTWLVPYVNNGWEPIVDGTTTKKGYPATNNRPDIFYRTISKDSPESVTTTTPKRLFPRNILELFTHITALNRFAINIDFLEESVGTFSEESQQDVCAFVIGLLKIDFETKGNCLRDIVETFLPFDYSEDNIGDDTVSQIQSKFPVGSGVIGVNTDQKDELYTGFEAFLQVQRGNERESMSEETVSFFGLVSETNAFNFDPEVWERVSSASLSKEKNNEVIINRLLADQYNFVEGDTFRIEQKIRDFYYQNKLIKLDDWTYKKPDGTFVPFTSLDPRAKFYYSSVMIRDLGGLFKHNSDKDGLLLDTAATEKTVPAETSTNEETSTNDNAKYTTVQLQTKYTDPVTNEVTYVDMLDMENFYLQIGKKKERPFLLDSRQFGFRTSRKEKARNWWTANIGNKKLAWRITRKKVPYTFEVSGIVDTYQNAQIFTSINTANIIRGYNKEQYEIPDSHLSRTFPGFFTGRMSFQEDLSKVIFDLGITHKFGVLDEATITYGGKSFIARDFHSAYAEKELYLDFLTFIIRLANIGLLINLLSTILLFTFVLRNSFEILKDSSIYLNVMGYTKKNLAQQAFLIFFVASFIGLILGVASTAGLVSVFKWKAVDSFSLYMFFVDGWTSYLMPVLLVLLIFGAVFWSYLRSFSRQNLSIKVKEEN